MRARVWCGTGLLLSLALGCSDSSGPGGPPAQIKLTPSDAAVVRKGSVQLTATVLDSSGHRTASGLIVWSSSNPALATVSSTGLVRSTGPAGSVVIRATAMDTLSDSATVVVLDSLLAARTQLLDRSYAAAISAEHAAYVSQSDLGMVLRVDLASGAVTDSITVGNTPTEMAFNSTGTRLYVTNQYGSSVSIVNVATNTAIGAIPVGNRPFEVIVEPGDSILWVGKIDSLYGIRLATQEIVSRFEIGDVGNGVAIARDTLLYVSTHTTGTIVEINLRTRTLGRTFQVGGVPQKLVVSPNGSELYIANESGYIQFWDLGTGQQIGTNLVLPSAAYGLARRPTNGLLYATSAYFGGGYIYVIDPVTRTLRYSAVVGGSTRHVVFTPDGTKGIVPNEGGYEGGWVDFIK